MKTKGSMTCAMSLLLLVIISLLAACIQSSRVSCARAQAANAIGAAMYSLFAQYDRDLLEDYHLFSLTPVMGIAALILHRSSHRQKLLPCLYSPLVSQIVSWIHAV